MGFRAQGNKGKSNGKEMDNINATALRLGRLEKRSAAEHAEAEQVSRDRSCETGGGGGRGRLGCGD